MITHSDISHSIFVVTIAYKDSSWLKNVLTIMELAKFPSRVFFGVLEYVEDMEESMAKRIPAKFRNNIRVLTLPTSLSMTLGASRRHVMQHLFQKEEYVLFTKSVILCDEWDEVLSMQLHKVDESSVISVKLGSSNTYSIITLADTTHLEVQYKTIDCMRCAHPVPSLTWHPDFTFAKSTLWPLVCADDTILGTTARLFTNGIRIYVPEHMIGERAPHPRGVRSESAVKVRADEVDNFLAHIRIHKEGELSATTMCGLTPDHTAQECIAKYGSVRDANFAVQNMR